MEPITKVVDVYGVETGRESQASKSSGNFEAPFCLVDTVCWSHVVTESVACCAFGKRLREEGVPRGGQRHTTTHAGPRKAPGC